MIRKIRVFIGALLLLSFMLCLVSCKEQPKKSKSTGITVYSVEASDRTRLAAWTRKSLKGSLQEKVSELLLAWRKPTSARFFCPLPAEIALPRITFNNDTCILSFSPRYISMDNLTELMVRASLVKTVCSMPEIKNVLFQIQGKSLEDSSGRVLGEMSPSDFPDSVQHALPTTGQKKSVYFADRNGKLLVKKEVIIHPDARISPEREILRKLIEGPTTNDVRPVLPPNLKILSINTQDYTCYVNFDRSFITNKKKVGDNLILYSIVNTLTDLKNITKVQILVNGSNVMNSSEGKLTLDPLSRKPELIKDSGS